MIRPPTKTSGTNSTSSDKHSLAKSHICMQNICGHIWSAGQVKPKKPCYFEILFKKNLSCLEVLTC